jgi:hypothetical protein
MDIWVAALDAAEAAYFAAQDAADAAYFAARAAERDAAEAELARINGVTS